MTIENLNNTLSAIDEINRQDPNSIVVDGNTQAKELVYGLQMTDCLKQYWPDANELLQIAVRAQHIKRWQLKRTEFAEGKAGYYQWRIAQGKFHAELTASIMVEQGYTVKESEQCAAIIRKENLTTNNDSQTLEDVACLVFLMHYFNEFAAKYTEQDNEAKIVRIVQLTWKKMSEQAHDIALSLTLPEHLAVIVTKALS
ncbi:DUF4202 domain-containing protein [Colwellia psychrerythraea]|uniref:DUF4202 domain-containing protein n=1 Tax=Colwellia psychrerythraea TaxID=28229 RepID=A0A099KYI6_COLPS|nr:DUF4202 domain-containing protein [Colwellia psychrerythraea]KGJ95606.1 Protein of unknown function DUF4202 [Colwellia psychrerythraea]